MRLKWVEGVNVYRANIERVDNYFLRFRGFAESSEIGGFYQRDNEFQDPGLKNWETRNFCEIPTILK